jgi:hypothetical protein
MGEVWSTPFEEVLVNATAVVQSFEGRLQSLRAVVDPVRIHTFVVNTSNGQDNSHIAAFG